MLCLRIFYLKPLRSEKKYKWTLKIKYRVARKPPVVYNCISDKQGRKEVEMSIQQIIKIAVIAVTAILNAIFVLLP